LLNVYMALLSMAIKNGTGYNKGKRKGSHRVIIL
jgi:hypothetical protein